jgi:(4S)-4-hydroxy-5-phosphonooxypentane-2,3-dione isomerase
MLVTCVHVEVKPECIQDFISECKKNHIESVKEPGNLRFDILQDAENPAKFLLYEAYQDESSSVAHKATNHYQAWKQAVEHMMDKPRKGIKYQILYPTDMNQW